MAIDSQDADQHVRTLHEGYPGSAEEWGEKERMKVKRETTIVAGVRTCRKPGCQRIGDYSRGLCEPCYRGTAKYVSDGVVTWRRLESQGKVDQTKATLKEWLLS